MRVGASEGARYPEGDETAGRAGSLEGEKRRRDRRVREESARGRGLGDGREIRGGKKCTRERKTETGRFTRGE